MCLQIDINNHDAEPGVVRTLIAGYDMLVYKVVKRVRYSDRPNVQYFAPYRNYEWTLNTPHTSVLEFDDSGYPVQDYRTPRINVGLHAKRDYKSGREELSSWGGVASGYVLLPAIIPKGAKFWVGCKNDIASDQMVLYRDMKAALKGRKLGKANILKHTLNIPGRGNT